MAFNAFVTGLLKALRVEWLEAGESPGEPNLGFIVDIGIRFDF
jgi:hypothetical protein